MSNKLKSLVPDCEEIKIDHVTSGASETCLVAKKFINNNEPLIITNCDQRLEWDSNKFLSFINENSYDGIIVTHESNNPKHSYANVDENDFVTPRFLLKAANMAIVLKRNDEALGYLKTIKEKYETS